MNITKSGTEEPYVVVIGAANLDILGFSKRPLIARDSNPGRVQICTGGVGRNIAENLSRLGARTELITALGTDLNADYIRESCVLAGISLEHSLTVPEYQSSTYIAMMDSDGDMTMALSDLSIIDHLDADFLSSKYRILSGAAVIVADTNLPEEALNYIVENFADSTICIDPVSSTKADKLIPIVGKVHTLKMNQIEAEAISGLPAGSDDEIRYCGASLLEKGVSRVFITRGKAGLFWCDNNGDGFRRSQDIKVVNTTGAGDSFMAGIVLATLYDFEIQETLSIASAIAALTISVEETVNPNMSKNKISEIANVKW
jgi:pseudouridine kinase